MRSHTSVVVASLLVLAASTNALLTPARHSVPSSLIAKTPASLTSTRLGNDAANAAAEMPRGGDSDATKSKGTGTATIPTEVFNLIKSIVGAGVLSLPAGKYKYSVLHYSTIQYNAVEAAS